MSLRIAPSANNPSQRSNTSKNGATPHLRNGAPSAPGVPDVLRASLSTPAPDNGPQAPSSTHPLEARLLQWRQTQDAMKMETLRRMYGIAEPVRRGMEMKMVREGQWRPAVLGGNAQSSIHEDILALGGRETEVTWEDVFHGDMLREGPTLHDEMEQRLKMNW
ncbi:20S proteasome maturation factor [Ophidiomyces ophidiicola]|nr:20S proteasome maturation factor [Ophidiomyces ophidiicola]KAI1985244.1 20S proteasome maturation factor [Ophidiomyces ophidiicola]KAI1990659.1 20S proteasome maturation factor [Ophidiomyces ophidiicola]